MGRLRSDEIGLWRLCVDRGKKRFEIIDFYVPCDKNVGRKKNEKVEHYTTD